LNEPVSFIDVDDTFKHMTYSLKYTLPKFKIKTSELLPDTPLEVYTQETVSIACRGRISPLSIFILNYKSVSDNYDVFVSSTEKVPTFENCDDRYCNQRSFKVHNILNQPKFVNEHIYITFESKKADVKLKI
jgi:hypothetical protein